MAATSNNKTTAPHILVAMADRKTALRPSPLVRTQKDLHLDCSRISVATLMGDVPPGTETERFFADRTALMRVATKTWVTVCCTWPNS